MSFHSQSRRTLLFSGLVLLIIQVSNARNFPPPNPPTVQSPVAYCQGSTAAALVATPGSGGTLTWYGMNAVGGTASAVAPVPATNAAGSMTYYISQTVNGVESGRAPITVTVKALPSPPTVSPVSYSQGAAASPLTATGQNLLWYTASSGGTPTTSITPSTTAIGTIVYYASQTVNGCESSRAGLSVTINAPNVPTITITDISNARLCTGNSFTVSFATSGTAFNAGNRFDIYISDANGSFSTQTKIGNGISSPITAVLPNTPNALPYGTNYRVKVITTDPMVASVQSSALAIGSLAGVTIYNRYYGSGSDYTNPSSICVGSYAILTAASYNDHNTPEISNSHEWYFNNILISGATSSTYSATEAGFYNVVVGQAGCLKHSTNTYTLKTTTNGFQSKIIAPTGITPQCDDYPITIQSDYIGESATYQWMRNGVDIAGATGYSIVVTQTGVYAQRLIDRSCSITSVNSPYFQVGKSLAVLIRGDTLQCPSGSNYLSLYDYPDKNSSYQWYIDGIEIPGAVNTVYRSIAPGLYTLSVQKGSCKTFSNSILVRHVNEITPSITLDYSPIACTGETRRLYVAQYLSSYQWQKDGIDIAGAVSRDYPATTSGKYTVRTLDGACTGISEPLLLTFGSLPQLKLNFYGDIAKGCAGVDMFPNSPYDNGNYQYQWFKDGVAIPNETDSYYTAYQSGLYSLKIVSNSCQGTSKEVFITVGEAPKPTIRLYERPISCAGNSIRLSASDITRLRQWKLNGTPISTPTYDDFYATKSGYYSVEVRSPNGCSAESDPAEIKIGEPTTAQLTGNALVSSGTAAQLPVIFTGPAPWSFTLTNGQSVQNTYQNPYLFSVTPATTTNYALSSIINGCGTGTVSSSALVTVGSGQADVSLNMAVSSRTPGVGDVVTYILTLNNAGPKEAVGVQVSSMLPAGLEFIDALSSGISLANGTVTAQAGTLPVHSITTLIFRAKATRPGVFAASAQVSATQTPDPDSQPNSGTNDGQDDASTADLRTSDGQGSLITSPNLAQTPLPRIQSNQPIAETGKADLSLSISTDKLFAEPNSLISLTLIVSSRGGAVANNVTLQTVLPSGWQVVSTAGLLVNGQTVTGGVGPVPVGGRVVRSLMVRVNGSGTLQSQIQGSDLDDPDSTPGNGFSKGEDDEATIQIRAR